VLTGVALATRGDVELDRTLLLGRVLRGVAALVPLLNVRGVALPLAAGVKEREPAGMVCVGCTGSSVSVASSPIALR
jgi:hypothetical protein